MRYLNFHAPGVGFADYMRGLRDGQRVSYDQEPPPPEGVRPPSEAEVGEPGLGVHLDIEAIRIAEVRTAPGDAPPPRTEHEYFYVLEGELELTLGDHELRAPAGSWVEMPTGIPHVITSPDPVRYLSVLTPLPS
jgi:quercetin dioxygenase-like cupin family protein